MEQAVLEALQALEVDYIDIFHLHAARADETVFEQRRGAWQCLLDCKAKGIIKAVGISTHSVAAASRAAEVDEVDVVFPIINQAGIGILHGSVTEMKGAIGQCLKQEKGVYLMKVLGGGSLVSDFHQAVGFAREIGRLSLALGMVSEAEVEYNLAYFKTQPVDLASLPPLLTEVKEFQIIDWLCKDCGTCMENCPNGAITKDPGEEKPRINADLCLRCGYCVGFCPEFAIRMV
ncbi:MAG: aldo/keto reductase [Deltaproteobacteria bacterium]|nr:aldo/keto reductase [Candidatus Anaeroferrophillus wilburensis]MBN2888037.1 aldo/keto reductase [Deltaproteobacteria bacterium]